MRSPLHLHIKYLEIEPRAGASRRRHPMDPPNINHMSPSTFDTSLLQPRQKKEKSAREYYRVDELQHTATHCNIDIFAGLGQTLLGFVVPPLISMKLSSSFSPRIQAKTWSGGGGGVSLWAIVAFGLSACFISTSTSLYNLFYG